jgi:ribosome-associated protein
VAEYENEFEDEWDEDFKSKTQVKQALNELKELGRELTSLPVADLDKLALPEDVYDNVLKAKKNDAWRTKASSWFFRWHYR